MTIKELILEKFNNVKYIAITGSESLLEASRGKDVDVVVIIKGHEKEREKFRFELDGQLIDVFVRDYEYYLKLIKFEEPDLMHLSLVFYPFAIELYNDDIPLPDFNLHKERIFNMTETSLFHIGGNEESDKKTMVSKKLNQAYLAKVLIEGKTELSLLDKEKILKIYNGDRIEIENLFKFFGLNLSNKIVRIL